MMSKYKNDDIYVARDRVQHICGQKYKNHVTGTRNTRMSHLAVLNPIMSHIYEMIIIDLVSPSIFPSPQVKEVSGGVLQNTFLKLF